MHLLQMYIMKLVRTVMIFSSIAVRNLSTKLAFYGPLHKKRVTSKTYNPANAE